MNSDLAPRLRSFSSAFALPLDKAIRAVSDAEKKAEQQKKSRTTQQKYQTYAA